MSFNISHIQSQKQTQRLMMSPQMQQAFMLLQLPIMELAAVVELELEQNPLLEPIEEQRDSDEAPEEQIEKELEFTDQDYSILENLEEEYAEHFAQSEGGYPPTMHDREKLKAFQESSIQKKPSLYEYLLQQAQETFDSEDDLYVAMQIIGHFDERGFLTTNLCEITPPACTLEHMKRILCEIQNFEPYGVGATNIQESLLIQLRCLGKKNLLAYEIVEKHYEDLLHNRLPKIEKSLGCVVTDIKEALDRHICPLDLRPGLQFTPHSIPYIRPDAILMKEGDHLIVAVEDDILPPVRFNHRYLRMLESEHVSTEDKLFIRQKILSAKWLIRNITHRNSIVERIAKALAHKQKEYFLSNKGKMIPLTMKTLADELDVHESTIARAVANKYIDTPRGLLPLRSFFSHTYVSKNGENVSSATVRDMVSELIVQENKSKPLSDAALSALLGAKGIICARRTVAKYRTELNLGNAQQRKEHKNRDR